MLAVPGPPQPNSLSSKEDQNMMTTLAGHRLQPRLAVLLPVVFCSIVCTGVLQAGPKSASPNGKVDGPNGNLPESSSELRNQISRLEQLILQQNEAITE